MPTVTNCPFTGWFRPRRPRARWHAVTHGACEADLMAYLPTVVRENGDTAVLPSHRPPAQQSPYYGTT